MSVTVSTPASDLEFNVSNNNFRSLMALVDVECGDELYFHFAGEALTRLHAQIEFVLASLAALPGFDTGTPTTTGVGMQGVVWIDCGRRPGYYADRLSRLRDITSAAIAAGTPVVCS